MTLKKKRILLIVIGLLAATAMVFGAALTSVSLIGADAYNASNLPTGTDAVGQLFNGTCFNSENLDKLAAFVNYPNFKAMVTAAEGGTLKNGGDFGEKTVALGSYTTIQGTEADLVWAPVYLTKDSDGNAILTLWLASIDETTTPPSYQETGVFSDGTSPMIPSGDTKPYTENNVTTNVYANNYDASYMRHVLLGLYKDDPTFRTSYSQAWGGYYTATSYVSYSGTIATPQPASAYNKFDMITTGVLNSYVVVPNKTYQKTENKFPNDLAYTGTNAANYTKNWGNDPIWLPSVAEQDSTYWSTPGNVDSTSATNYTSMRNGAPFSSTEKGCSVGFRKEDTSVVYTAPNGIRAIRPAFHLNLTKIAAGLLDNSPANPTAATYNKTEQTIDFASATNFDSSKMYVSSITRDGTALPTGYTNASVVTPDAPLTATDATKIKFTEAGTYKIKIQTKDTSVPGVKYTFKDTNKDTKELTLTVNQIELENPSCGATTPTYNGSVQSFTISNYLCNDTSNPTLYPRDPMGQKIERHNGSTYASTWPVSAPNEVLNATASTIEYQIKEAGKYQATFEIKDTVNYKWKNGTGNKTVQFEIARKTLLVDFKSTTNLFTLDAGDTVSFSADPNNHVSGDTVKLSLFYRISTSGADERNTVASGSLDASVLTPGTYYLYAKLEDSVATDNINYALNGGEVSRQFTVNAKAIALSGVDWQYSQNNGTPVDVTSGAGATAGSPFTVTYNGSAYVFSIKTADLATAGAKIDVGYASGGYANSMHTNAMASAVAVTVRLVPFDSQYAFYDQYGVKLATQVKDFTLYVKVEKAEVDFSNVVWSAEELEYNAVNQTVRITSGFPSFLTPSYNSASTGREVGDYTAQVTGATIADATVAANYNVPSATQIAGITELTHAWKIIKKKINVSWTSVEETGEGGTVIFVPAISDNSANAVEYTYYNEDKSKKMTLDEIFADYDATETKDYWVCVRLKTGTGTYNATNCVLVEGGTEVPESYHGFSVGENKNPVRVGLKTNQTVYNKAEQPAEIEFEGGNLTASDFEISYKKSDGTDCTTPKNAGQYKVIVKLKGDVTDDYAITGQCEFDYEVKKATYDVSSMKWVDVLNANAEYTEAYVWAYDEDSDTKGKVHTLSFVGDNIDGLNVNYTTATEENLTGSNAGTYQVEVEFNVVDADNYEVPDNIDFTWEIKPLAPDLSEVKWNYDSAFTFHIDEAGNPVKHSVRLINLPEGMEGLIDYSGDTDEYSDAGPHVTLFEVNTAHAMYGNFVTPFVFGAGVEERLVWEIKSLTIEKPQQRQTKSFRPEGYTFQEITNLPEDWERYFNVTVLDGEDATIAPTEGTWKFTAVDQYRIQIQFKPGMNIAAGGTTDNVKWSDNGRGAYQVTLTLKTLVFPVRGWIDQGENTRPTLDADDLTEIERYFDYVLYDPEKQEEVALNAILEYETVYTIKLKLKSEYGEGSVAVKYLGKEVEETSPYAFQTGFDPLAPDPTDFFDKPTELRIVHRYTGSEIEFKLGNWFVEEKMQVMYGSATKGTDEGTYLVRVGFKKGARSAWKTEGNDFDRAPITITHVISGEAGANDRFILKDIYKDNHPYKFLYANFSEASDVSDYEYDASLPLFIARLALGDTLKDLIAQFENADDITAWDAKGGKITDLSTVLATGMMLRLMDGETVLNQLIISVLGDVNGDGRVNVTDKTQINANLAGKRQLETASLLASDINGDGRINVTDKTQLNAQLAGKRDIYAGLSLKTAKAASISNAPLLASVEEITAVQEETTTVPEEIGVDFAEEEATVSVSENMESGIVIQELIADWNRCAICGRKEF